MIFSGNKNLLIVFGLWIYSFLLVLPTILEIHGKVLNNEIMESFIFYLESLVMTQSWGNVDTSRKMNMKHPILGAFIFVLDL